jgi:hypothetical protein
MAERERGSARITRLLCRMWDITSPSRLKRTKKHARKHQRLSQYARGAHSTAIRSMLRAGHRIFELTSPQESLVDDGDRVREQDAGDDQAVERESHGEVRGGMSRSMERERERECATGRELQEKSDRSIEMDGEIWRRGNARGGREQSSMSAALRCIPFSACRLAPISPCCRSSRAAIGWHHREPHGRGSDDKPPAGGRSDQPKRRRARPSSLDARASS